MADEQALAAVAADVAACARCELHRGARLAVPGSGSPRAEIMLIGEAPSQYDDRSGTPFSGPSGAFLDELLALVGLRRDDVFLTNIVKHRVPGGRELAPGEVQACAPYLTRQIAALDPLVVVTLGRGALHHFIPSGKISQLHGQARVARGRMVVAMYNPAAALHQEALRQTVLDDFRRAIPAALAEARRLQAAGALGQAVAPDADAPQQQSLF
ncbi:MAG TPA: uracil-DNA glycosylase [Ktedonobacterales bacterium]|nr:uracil-DNA glycosylase [Ktedonobacterales bacterium]